MKLLILTQVVDTNDSVLGFFHRWIEEFSKHADSITVICLKEGEHHLPPNVRVFSLGKEKGRVSRLQYAVRFWRLIWREHRNYDVVFVHMNVEYVMLGGPLWRLWGKKVGLWYLHKSVSLRLRVAVFFANHVFTGTKQSLRLETPKLHIMGQGIDVETFSSIAKQMPEVFTVLFVGRLSPIKGVETLIEAASILRKKGMLLRVEIIGGADTLDQVTYLQKLQNLVAKENLWEIVSFVGPVKNELLPTRLARASVFVNTSRTGSLDKAGIEPMAMALPVVSCNDSYAAIVGPYGLFYEEGDAVTLADILQRLADEPKEAERIGAALQTEARQYHNLATLVPAILKILQNQN